ncbi:2,3,4,5-tetrahydropyridine-2,6-dicarboxylate N-succinyltransferase [Paracoccaceae bacterium]|nr:2,3,4,5-tetrahydropyridine-2,6-dicarboxylate N-succinyltransferase [Paracoccaceae bacterium]
MDTKSNGQDAWRTNDWVIQALQLSDDMANFTSISGGPQHGSWWDKTTSKFADWPLEQFERADFRIVPNCHIRKSAYISPGCVIMPSFLDVGVHIGERTTVDTWASLGACSQIGSNVHLSGGVGVGGSLGAAPTIIEDHCFIGARSEIKSGVWVGEGAVVSMGVLIDESTPIIKRDTDEQWTGYIPPYSVVVPGTIPIKSDKHDLELSRYCAVVIKVVDARTRGKVEINDLLRG